jgi:hypothetical protein
MLGAVPLEFEVEVVLAQPLMKRTNAARRDTADTRIQLIYTSENVGGGRNAGGTTDNTAKQSRQAGQFNIPKKSARKSIPTWIIKKIGTGAPIWKKRRARCDSRPS